MDGFWYGVLASVAWLVVGGLFALYEADGDVEEVFFFLLFWPAIALFISALWGYGFILSLIDPKGRR